MPQSSIEQGTSPISPKSPLIPLRLASGDSKFEHDGSESRRNKQHGDRSNTKAQTKAVLSSLEPRTASGSNDWFNFDFPKHKTNSANGHKPTKEVQAKEISQLASLLLDTKKVGQDHDLVQPPTEDTKHSRVVASSSTLARADKVRTMLGLKYLYVHRVYEWLESSKEISYPGVEGVYNPLQIIRNRKVRAKHKEYPRQLAIKLLPLPCNAFSSHNDSKRSWRMLWGIDLNELINDTAWRQDRWHELKNPKGELWFPRRSKSNDSSLEIPGHRHNLRKRLHEKLFADEASVGSKELKSLSLNSSLTDEDDNKYLFQISRARLPNPRRRDQIKQSVRRRARKLYLGSSPSTSELESEDDFDEKPQQEDLNKQLFKRVLPVSPSQEELGPLDEVPKQKMTPPEIFVETDNDVKKVPFKALQRSHFDPDELIEVVTDNDVESTHISAELLEACDNDVCITRSKFSYFQGVIDFKVHYMTNLYPELINRLLMMMKQIVDEDLVNLNLSAVEIHDDILPTYELFYNGFNDEIKSVLHEINDNYSVRIDNLLSSSDRLIGEVNTSISHELRKVNEKLDRLNNSFFGGMMASALKDTDYVNITDSGNKQVLYFILENCIVITLRIVWVLANIVRVVLFIFRIIWKFIRLFI